VEITTGLLAVVGGSALIVRPDGSLLRADPSSLERSPFVDWRVPGVLLTTLVGGGFLFAAESLRRGLPWARVISVAAGLGLMLFESAEIAWIGYQPLEVVFIGVGGAVAALAVSTTSPGHAAPRP
jgi:hypothetical protein